MNHVGFWSRINTWLRGNDRAETQSATTACVGADITAEMPSLRPPDGVLHQNAPHSRDAARIKANSRPDAATSDQLMGLVETIKDNLNAQVQGADVLVGSLDRLAESLERLPELAKSEAGVLEKIAADVTAGVGGLKRLEIVLSQWPQLVDAQRESHVMLTRELERTRQSHDQVITTLETLQKGLVARDTAMDQAVTVLREFRADGCRREERLNQLTALLSQRLLWATAALAGLSTLGLILALIALSRS